ncbi:MAG: hypothetical protein HY348_07335 [Nitrospira defluvii]|nr:hypothetical protein [Nitrospira defluvii]
MKTKQLIEAYYEISIEPHHAGFGMYQPGEHNYAPQYAWADLSDLEQEMADGGSNALLPLDEALHDADFIGAGIDDIRGKIYGGDPLKIYAALRAGEIRYCGVERAEVPADYWDTRA